MKIEMADGRSPSTAFASDTSTAFLVNEEVVRIMGVESGVGQRFSFVGIDGEIIGVMKNYHFQSVRYDIEPLALVVNPRRINYAVIRLQAGRIQEALDYVETTWERVIPDYPFAYQFLDEDFDQMYRDEARMGKLLRSFAVQAVVIACLGLFGLASFTAEQRTKEIGVRKVLGASVPSIVFLLSTEFAKWVLVANAIAWPVAYFILENWLEAFAYRTSLAWWIFALSGVLALGVALVTVGFQSVKAASTGKLLRSFAVLAVVIACLGLFGLASFTAEQRTKEIGVRKVLGASVPSIVFLLSTEFAKWVLVANAIAWPVAYFILENWLEAFAYRTSLAWWIFALSGVLALGVALVTVGFQSVKAAYTNPADALRYQ